MYSYDWLENLIGLRMHSAKRVQPEWQTLDVGDRVRMVPDRWLGLDTDSFPTNTVVSLNAGHQLVMRQIVPATGRPPLAYDGTWSFVLLSEGDDRCRLLARGRTLTKSRSGTLQWVLQAPLHLFMERKMLLGIKSRAERSSRRIS
jgi:hypothetical protein